MRVRSFEKRVGSFRIAIIAAASSRLRFNASVLLQLSVLNYLFFKIFFSLKLGLYSSWNSRVFCHLPLKNDREEGRSRLLDPTAGVRLRRDHRRSTDRRRDRTLETEGEGTEAVGSLEALLEKAPSGVASCISSSRCADNVLLPLSDGSSLWRLLLLLLYSVKFLTFFRFMLKFPWI